MTEESKETKAKTEKDTDKAQQDITATASRPVCGSL